MNLVSKTPHHPFTIGLTCTSETDWVIVGTVNSVPNLQKEVGSYFE